LNFLGELFFNEEGMKSDPSAWSYGSAEDFAVAVEKKKKKKKFRGN
jgi:hypothetical protein